MADRSGQRKPRGDPRLCHIRLPPRLYPIAEFLGNPLNMEGTEWAANLLGLFLRIREIRYNTVLGARCAGKQVSAFA